MAEKAGHSAHSPWHLVQQRFSFLALPEQAEGGHSWRWQCVSPACEG